LEQARKSGIVVPDLDDAPQLPYATQHIWGWFAELHSSRTGSGFAPNPLTYEAIYAWSQLTKNFPTPYEISVIKAIDTAYLSTFVKKKQVTDARHSDPEH
jgi:hypothetical protein